MKFFLGIEKTPSDMEQSFKASPKLKSELPKDIEIKNIRPVKLPYFS